MRSTVAGILVLGILAASCAADSSDAAGDLPESASTDSTSPLTTPPVETVPVEAFPVETSPVNAPGVENPPVELSPELTVVDGDQGDVAAPASEELPVTTNPPEKTAEVSPSIARVEPLPDGPVASAVADLAGRLGVDQASITLISYQQVTWPDGSIGCPQPGTGYTQALVGGTLIVLETGGRLYEYHSGGSIDPFYCANPTPPTTGEHGDT